MSDELIVYGPDGGTYDLAWLQAHYGAGIKLHRYASPEKGYFKLTGVNVMTSGDVLIRLWVTGADGKPKIGQPTTYSYPSLDNPSPDLSQIGGGVSVWAARGVLNKNKVDGSGKVEYQIGSDSWIKGDRGPYSAWVLSPSIGSDCLDGIGWKGGTNHEGPTELWFTEVLPAAVVPDPDPEPKPNPTPQGSGCLFALLSGIQAMLKALSK